MTSMTTAKPPQTQIERQREAARDRTTTTVAPPVDIYETDTGYVILADMPGVRADGLEVIAERDELTIRGRVDRQEEAAPNYREFELSNYYRAFTLTQDLETNDVSATLRDGELRVEIPKSARLRPKKIQVHAE